MIKILHKKSFRKLAIFIVIFSILLYPVRQIKASAVPAVAPFLIGWGIFAIGSGVVNPSFSSDNALANSGVQKSSVYNPYSKEGLDRAADFWSTALKGDWVCCTMLAIDDVQDSMVYRKVKDETFDILKSTKEFYFGNAEQKEAFAKAKQAENVAQASYELSKVDWSGTEFSKYIDYEVDTEATKKFHNYFNDYASEQGRMVRQCLYDNVDEATLKLFHCDNKDDFIRNLDNQINNGLVSLSNQQLQAINNLLYMKLNGCPIDISRGKLLRYEELKNMSISFADPIYITPVSYIKSSTIEPFTYTITATGDFEVSFYKISDGTLIESYILSSSGNWKPIRESYGYIYKAVSYILQASNTTADFATVKFNEYDVDKPSELIGIYKMGISYSGDGSVPFLKNKRPIVMYNNDFTFMMSTSFPKVVDKVPTDNLGTTDINKQSKRIDGVPIDGNVAIPVPKPQVLPGTNVNSVVKPIAQSIPQAQAVSVAPAVPAVPDLPDMSVPNDITGKFPFCIPFDLIRGFKVLIVPPEAPYLKQNIGTTVKGYYIGGVLELDFSMFDKVAYLSRWLFTIGFCYFLLLSTRKLIKW